MLKIKFFLYRIGTLDLLQEVGIRILNYIDDWLIMARSREQLCDHRDLVLQHLSQLGLWVNWEKSKLSPMKRISSLGVELDSLSMTAHLTNERAQSVLDCLISFRRRTMVPLKHFQRLLGHMASTAAVTPLGLLHMRPLQHWLQRSSRQPLPGASPWNRTFSLRGSAPYGTRVQTSGTSVCGSWTGCGRLAHLSPAVVNTITQVRAPSTRQAYALKWSLFANWCSSRREDPLRCPISVVLSFLQERLECRLSPSTLKVFVAAIAAHHDAVDCRSLGKHDLIVRFLRVARRLNPPRPPLVPSWDFSVVLAGLQRGPFEPLDSVEIKFQSAKKIMAYFAFEPIC